VRWWTETALVDMGSTMQITQISAHLRVRARATAETLSRWSTALTTAECGLDLMEAGDSA
jgi:hypothetical protein